MSDESSNSNLRPWIDPEIEARIVALALGEASDFEREELERMIAEDRDLAAYRQRIESVHGLIEGVAEGSQTADSDVALELPTAMRDELFAAFATAPGTAADEDSMPTAIAGASASAALAEPSQEASPSPTTSALPFPLRLRKALAIAAVVAGLAIVGAMTMPVAEFHRISYTEEDSVPTLGNIPVIGRMFSNDMEGESRERDFRIAEPTTVAAGAAGEAQPSAADANRRAREALGSMNSDATPAYAMTLAEGEPVDAYGRGARRYTVGGAPVRQDYGIPTADEASPEADESGRFNFTLGYRFDGESEQAIDEKIASTEVAKRSLERLKNMNYFDDVELVQTKDASIAEGETARFYRSAPMDVVALESAESKVAVEGAVSPSSESAPIPAPSTTASRMARQAPAPGDIDVDLTDAIAMNTGDIATEAQIGHGGTTSQFGMDFKTNADVVEFDGFINYGAPIEKPQGEVTLTGGNQNDVAIGHGGTWKQEFGDFDNGMGGAIDGPFIAKTDEANTHSLRTRTAAPQSPPQNQPMFQREFLGGADNLRGFQYREEAPGNPGDLRSGKTNSLLQAGSNVVIGADGDGDEVTSASDGAGMRREGRADSQFFGRPSRDSGGATEPPSGDKGREALSLAQFDTRLAKNLERSDARAEGSDNESLHEQQNREAAEQLGAGGYDSVRGYEERLHRSDGQLAASSTEELRKMRSIAPGGGDAIMLGETVDNQGALGAVDGTIALGAGGDVLVSQAGEAKNSVRRGSANDEKSKGLADIAGNVVGSNVELKAHGNLYAQGIDNSGTIRATGVTENGGRVILSPRGTTTNNNTGEVRATNTDASGGFIMAEAGGYGGVLNIDGAVRTDGLGNTPGGKVTLLGEEMGLGPNADARADGSVGGAVIVGSGDETTSIRAAAGSRVAANGSVSDKQEAATAGNQQSFSNFRTAGERGLHMGHAQTTPIRIQPTSGTTNGETVSANGSTGVGGAVIVAGKPDSVISMDGTISATGAVSGGGMVTVTGGDIQVGASGVISSSGSVDGGFVGIDAVDTTNIAGALLSDETESAAEGMVVSNRDGVAINRSGTVMAAGGTNGGAIAIDSAGSTTIDGGASINIGGEFQGKDSGVATPTPAAQPEPTAAARGETAMHFKLAADTNAPSEAARPGSGGLIEVSGKQSISLRKSADKDAEMEVRESEVVFEKKMQPDTAQVLAAERGRIRSVVPHVVGGGKATALGRVDIDGSDKIEDPVIRREVLKQQPDELYDVAQKPAQRDNSIAWNSNADLGIHAAGNLTVSSEVKNAGSGDANQITGWERTEAPEAGSRFGNTEVAVANQTMRGGNAGDEALPGFHQEQEQQSAPSRRRIQMDGVPGEEVRFASDVSKVDSVTDLAAGNEKDFRKARASESARESQTEGESRVANRLNHRVQRLNEEYESLKSVDANGNALTGNQLPPLRDLAFVAQESEDRLEQLNSEMKITSKFIEVPDQGMEGFDWLLRQGGTSESDTESDGDGIADRLTSLASIVPKPTLREQITSGNRSGSFAVSDDSIDGLISSAGTAAADSDKAPEVFGVAGVFTDTHYTEALGALTQNTEAVRVAPTQGQNFWAWHDDETSKSNINTSTGGTAWDTPQAAGDIDQGSANYGPSTVWFIQNLDRPKVPSNTSFDISDFEDTRAEPPASPAGADITKGFAQIGHGYFDPDNSDNTNGIRRKKAESLSNDLSWLNEKPHRPSEPAPMNYLWGGTVADSAATREFLYPTEFDPPEIPNFVFTGAAKPPQLLAERSERISTVVSGPSAATDHFSSELPGNTLTLAVRPEFSFVQSPAAAPKKAPVPEGLDEIATSDEAFSTFSLHVSDVSFTLAKTALDKGEWPDAERIRVEEFVNAFDYGDPLPSLDDKVACQMEQTIHPFLQQRNLLRLSMRTAAAGRSQATPLHLTLVLDHSGSMERQDRQQTVQRAFVQLADQLTENDTVTVIGFARQPRLLVDRASGDSRDLLLAAVGDTPSEGGTHLESALDLAFEKAREQSPQNSDAQNRIILLTDGAANLGDAEPHRLAEKVHNMRESGIAFDAAGIGADGLNDEILEALTRKGDGRYYLLDQPDDADEGFARQIAGALRPAAKNVKVQIEFNPERVASYKLLGFEKHRLKKGDFRDDKVDAAEIAAEEAGVAVYQFEPLADGKGDVGTAFLRFRDMSSGEMVEKRWPIAYAPNAPRPDQASPKIRLATAAALFAAKLKGDALGASVDLAELTQLLDSLPPQLRELERVQHLHAMIEKARNLDTQ